MPANATDGLHWVFGVPLFSRIHHNVSDLNMQLAEAILAAERSMDGVRHSNVGGWQSPSSLHTWKVPAIGSLLDIINDDIRSYLDHAEHSKDGDTGIKWTLTLWANVNRRGHFNSLHHHNSSGRSFVSGIYYVTADHQSKGEGNVTFHNPSANGHIAQLTRGPDCLRKWYPSDITIQPTSGLVLLFPSWLEHWVTPHTSEDPRVSVAFNVAFAI